MKIMIAIPCMDMMPVPFVKSLLFMDKTDETSISLASGSLVYDSRNELLKRALDHGIDRVLWLDSDMDVPADALRILSGDIDAGHDIVSGLCFKRRPPFTPCVWSKCCLEEHDGAKVPVAEYVREIPEGIFEAAAVGFGCVMMSMEAVRRITAEYGPYLFMPAAGFGEDLSFCLRAQAAGVKIWCDPHVECGHVGYHTFGREDYKAFNEKEG